MGVEQKEMKMSFPLNDPWTEDLLEKMKKSRTSEEMIDISSDVLLKMGEEIIILRFLVEENEEKVDLVSLKKMILALRQEGLNVFDSVPLEMAICAISKRYGGELYLRSLSNEIYNTLNSRFSFKQKSVMGMQIFI